MPGLRNENHMPRADPRAAAIGAQLRAARLAARKSMAEVAQQAGLTKGYLSKLERDLVNVSVASLLRLCDTLDVPVSSLFQPATGEIVRASARQLSGSSWGTGNRAFSLSPPGERRIQAFVSEIAPGGTSGDEPYSLPVDVEFFFVLAGQLQVTIEGEQLTLEQGDAFTFSGSAQRAFRVAPDAEPTVILVVISPAMPATDRRL
ncbi:MAG TPA: XRE family transcriptional regulator [Streptosporangiaceae bacterium]|nr:XRE family transcriptional regulator [Streptosporangiaceae bacterium]